MDVHRFLENVQVVNIAGGPGSRLKHRTGDAIPKPLVMINGTTLVDIAIELYKRNGCNNFVFLLGHLGDKVVDYLKNRRDIELRYVIEPEKLGKAGALKYGLDTRTIDRTRPCIVTYPDDLIFDTDFPRKLAEKHLEGLRKGCKATAVRVDKTRYVYGIVRTDASGVVTGFEEKPWIDCSTNVGIYVFEPEIYEIIDRIINLDNKPLDIETHLLPYLIDNRLLYAFTIPSEDWIPVNEEKNYQEAEARLAHK